MVFLPNDPSRGDGGVIPIRPRPPLPNKTIGTNPGLLTSTGGLQGSSELLLTPAFNPVTGISFIITHEALNFNCEEDSEYQYRQECNFGQFPGEGRNATFHGVILKYRELGEAKFSINITVYKQKTDEFETVQIPVDIPFIPIAKLSKARKRSFPDGRIHTVRIAPPKGVFQGERPQVSITRRGDSGPLSITKLTLYGNADELVQQ